MRDEPSAHGEQQPSSHQRSRPELGPSKTLSRRSGNQEGRPRTATDARRDPSRRVRSWSYFRVSDFDGLETGLVPRRLVATTEQVYDAPRVSAVTVIGLTPAMDDPVAPPFDEVHVAM